MIKKFVIRDKTHNLYVQCWTEGETIFLTSNMDHIEFYKSLEDANSMVERIQHYAERFLHDSRSEEELHNVVLESGTLEIQTVFVPAS